MNKQTIITILLALVAMAGHAQIHYRLEGNIGRPDLTDTLSVIENRGFEKDGSILSETIDTLYIVNGNIVPIEGTLPESVTVTAMNKTLSTQLIHIMLTDGTTYINGTLNDFVVRQSGNPLADAMNQMEEDRLQLTKDITDLMNSGEPIDTIALIAREDSFVVSILKAHPNDQIGVVCMLDYADDICVLSPRRGIELIDMLDSSLVVKEPKLKGKKRDLQTRISTSEGAMFRDFTAEYDGKQQRLSDYVGRGQYVLVDKVCKSWVSPVWRNRSAASNMSVSRTFPILRYSMWECLSCNSTALTAFPTSSFSPPTAPSSHVDYVVWTSIGNSKRYSTITNKLKKLS